MINLPINIDYRSKVVVITGAGGLICGAMAKAFAQSGAKVAALDLNEEAVKKLADELKAEGFICKGYKANVLDPEGLEEVHKAVLNDLGACDILVNGAGGITRERRPTMNINTRQKRARNRSLTSNPTAWISCSSSISKAHYFRHRCLRRIWLQKRADVFSTYLQ